MSLSLPEAFYVALCFVDLCLSPLPLEVGQEGTGAPGKRMGRCETVPAAGSHACRERYRSEGLFLASQSILAMATHQAASAASLFCIE